MYTYLGNTADHLPDSRVNPNSAQAPSRMSAAVRADCNFDSGGLYNCMEIRKVSVILCRIWSTEDVSHTSHLRTFDIDKNGTVSKRICVCVNNAIAGSSSWLHTCSASLLSSLLGIDDVNLNVASKWMSTIQLSQNSLELNCSLFSAGPLGTYPRFRSCRYVAIRHLCGDFGLDGDWMHIHQLRLDFHLDSFRVRL